MTILGKKQMSEEDIKLNYISGHSQGLERSHYDGDQDHRWSNQHQRKYRGSQ